MKKTFIIMACVLGLTQVGYAQEVDKDLVTGTAEAAQTAGEELKKIEVAKENPWKFDGVVGLNAAATGLVNWAAGGKNNVNGVAFGKLHLLYHKDAIAWETNFDTDYGMTWIDQEEDQFQKSSDNIKLTTKFGWEFHKNWYLTVLGAFQSQYALGRDYIPGYNPIVSKWLAPSYTDISVGIDWKKSVNGADFSVYVSPIAGRISTAYVGDAWNKKYTEKEYLGFRDNIIADDNAAAADKVQAAAEKVAYNFSNVSEAGEDLRTRLQDKYGVYKFEKELDAAGQNIKHYQNVRAEFGLSIRGGIAYKYENLTIGTTLGLFTPYAWDKTEISDDYFKYRDMNRRFGNFDVDWDVAISYQFAKVFNVTLSTSMKYYNGVLVENKDGVAAERVQFKSVLGLGIGYSF